MVYVHFPSTAPAPQCRTLIYVPPFKTDHGDHVAITRSRGGNGGGLVMLGRSDGVLCVCSNQISLTSACELKVCLLERNPGGVRFGSSELYDVVDTCFKPGPTTAPEHVIVDCLAVGQNIGNGTDERVILFIKLDEGFAISEDLESRIRAEIRSRRSARHVPAKASYRRITDEIAEMPQLTIRVSIVQIIQVRDIPYTLNGKRVEVPVKKVRLSRESGTVFCNVSDAREVV